MGNKNLLFLARWGVISHSSDICTYIFDFYAIWCKYNTVNRDTWAYMIVCIICIDFALSCLYAQYYRIMFCLITVV